MDKIKLVLFSIVTLALVGILGYWAVVSLQSGTDYKNSQKVQQLEKNNQDLQIEVKNLTAQLAVLQSKAEIPAPIAEPELAPVTTYKYQTLMNELQKLVSAKVFLKLKSSGASVGTVQKFLNIYNKTSNKIDNDYGASTKTAVTAFQKAEGLTADGEVASGTFNKMIDWLKKQN